MKIVLFQLFWAVSLSTSSIIQDFQDLVDVLDQDPLNNGVNKFYKWMYSNPQAPNFISQQKSWRGSFSNKEISPSEESSTTDGKQTVLEVPEPETTSDIPGGQIYVNSFLTIRNAAVPENYSSDDSILSNTLQNLGAPYAKEVFQDDTNESEDGRLNSLPIETETMNGDKINNEVNKRDFESEKNNNDPSVNVKDEPRSTEPIFLHKKWKRVLYKDGKKRAKRVRKNGAFEESDGTLEHQEVNDIPTGPSNTDVTREREVKEGQVPLSSWRPDAQLNFNGLSSHKTKRSVTINTERRLQGGSGISTENELRNETQFGQADGLIIQETEPQSQPFEMPKLDEERKNDDYESRGTRSESYGNIENNRVAVAHQTNRFPRIRDVSTAEETTQSEHQPETTPATKIRKNRRKKVKAPILQMQPKTNETDHNIKEEKDIANKPGTWKTSKSNAKDKGVKKEEFLDKELKRKKNVVKLPKSVDFDDEEKTKQTLQVSTTTFVYDHLESQTEGTILTTTEQIPDTKSYSPPLDETKEQISGIKEIVNTNELLSPEMTTVKLQGEHDNKMVGTPTVITTSDQDISATELKPIEASSSLAPATLNTDERKPESFSKTAKDNEETTKTPVDVPLNLNTATAKIADTKPKNVVSISNKFSAEPKVTQHGKKELATEATVRPVEKKITDNNKKKETTRTDVTHTFEHIPKNTIVSGGKKPTKDKEKVDVEKFNVKSFIGKKRQQSDEKGMPKNREDERVKQTSLHHDFTQKTRKSSTQHQVPIVSKGGYRSQHVLKPITATNGTASTMSPPKNSEARSTGDDDLGSDKDNSLRINTKATKTRLPPSSNRISDDEDLAAENEKSTLHKDKKKNTDIFGVSVPFDSDEPLDPERLLGPFDFGDDDDDDDDKSSTRTKPKSSSPKKSEPKQKTKSSIDKNQEPSEKKNQDSSEKKKIPAKKKNNKSENPSQVEILVNDEDDEVYVSGARACETDEKNHLKEVCAWRGNKESESGQEYTRVMFCCDSLALSSCMFRRLSALGCAMDRDLKIFTSYNTKAFSDLGCRETIKLDPKFCRKRNSETER